METTRSKSKKRNGDKSRLKETSVVFNAATIGNRSRQLTPSRSLLDPTRDAVVKLKR